MSMMEAPPSAASLGAQERESTTAYDFRRPTTFAREHVRSLAVAHEVFVRRFASGLNGALRTVVQMEPVSVEQMSYDDYIRSMPNPTVLTTVGLAPLPAAAVLEMNVQLALVLVDRMLGGQGLPVAPRRPTEVETHLLHELVGNGLEAFRETFKPLADVTPSVGHVDYNPQLVQVVAPSEVVLLLTYRVTIAQGARAEGLLTICYPYSTLGPALGQLASSLWLDPALPAASGTAGAPLRDKVPAVPLRLAVQADSIRVPAREMAALQPGHVLQLDHRADEPLRGVVGGVDVVAGHIGRRGRRLAFQIHGWRAQPEPDGPDVTSAVPPSVVTPALPGPPTPPEPAPDLPTDLPTDLPWRDSDG